MSMAQINGIQMYHEIHGQGYPLVLIHGLSAASTAWAFQVPEFSQRYQVVSMDLRGHGQSDKPEMKYSIGLFTRDVVALMDHLGIEQAHIVGASMGGMVAQQLALDYPQRVHRLILADSMSHLDKSLRMNMEGGALIAERLGMEAQARNAMPWAFSPWYINEHYDEIVAIIEQVATLPVQPYLQSVAATVAHDVRERLGDIAAPTLVITGDQDILVPRQYAEILCQSIPDCRLVVIEGAAHVVNIEQPEAFNAAVLSFLAEAQTN
ncbi:MAG: alpha/beta fold hydrolase [Chloroflexota bacterium]